MIDFILQHQFWAAVGLYWIFSAAVSAMPEPEARRQCGISVAVSVFAHDGREYLDGSGISDSGIQDPRSVAAGAAGLSDGGVRGAVPGPSGGSERYRLGGL